MSNVITLNPRQSAPSHAAPTGRNTDLYRKLNANGMDDIGSLYNRIQTLGREDYAVPANSMLVDYTDDGYVINCEQGKEQHTWTANPHAISSLSDKLSKGLRSFGNELDARGHHDLKAKILREMLQRAPENQLFQVRTIAPQGDRFARAVVSSKYKPIDDNILVDPMLELLGDHSKDWRALGGQISDTHTRLRFISREPVAYNIGPNNRAWHVGFEFKNSEVGCSSASMSMFVFDGFCENGMVFNSRSITAVSMRHSGAKITSDFGLIQEERIRQLEVAAIQGSIREATNHVISADFPQRLTSWLEASQSRTLEGNAEQKIGLIKHLGQYAGLTKPQCEQVASFWDSREQNVFGVANAITRLAQEQDTFETRVGLESAGGKLMEMSNSRWKSIQALAAG